MSGIPIPWKKIITMTISTDAAQYMKEYVTPSKTNPMAHINPLDSRPFNFETMSDPTNAPAAIQPSVNAKSDAVPCNAIFTKIMTGALGNPALKIDGEQAYKDVDEITVTDVKGKKGKRKGYITVSGTAPE